jgi:predicted metalloprotease with PDZ domain
MLPLVWTSSGRGATPGHARIWFSGLPSSWRIATVARHEGNAYETDDMRDIVFALGPLRTRHFNIGPRTVTVAILGEWAASDERIFEALQSIAGNLHSIAGDGWRDGPHLIVAGRVPAGPEGLATGGQVLGRTGLVYVGGTWPGTLGFERWLFTAAHELTHWYIPTAFRFREQPPSWFAEGFTDYMALKTLLVGGLIPAPQFLMEMGERLVRYQSSPLYGHTSMAEAQSDFWREDDYRFIYDGGSAAAFLLDLGFQGRGGSLERALRELSRAGELDEERIVRALSTVRENEWLTAWLATGENPDWEARLRDYGMELQGGRLSATESRATDELSTIRP